MVTVQLPAHVLSHAHSQCNMHAYICVTRCYDRLQEQLNVAAIQKSCTQDLSPLQTNVQRMLQCSNYTLIMSYFESTPYVSIEEHALPMPVTHCSSHH